MKFLTNTPKLSKPNTKYLGRLTANKLRSIGTHWHHADDIGIWLSGSSWSLALICLYVSSLRCKRIKLMVPAYFCNSALRYVRDIGVDIYFYEVNENFEPNVKSISDIEKNNKIDILLSVHYFGASRSMVEVGNYCISKNIYLIEDATHLLKKTDGVGDNCDFVMYSPYKFLAIPNGAILSIQRKSSQLLMQDENLIYRIKKAKKELIRFASQNNEINIFSWLIKSLLSSYCPAVLKNIEYRNPWNESNYTGYGYPYIHPLGLKIIYCLTYKFDAIVLKRKANSKLWKDALSPADKCITLPSYMANVRVEGSEIDRKFFYSECKKIGVHITTWPDLPKEVLSNPILYKSAIDLRSFSFFFPASEQNHPVDIILKIQELKKKLRTTNHVAKIDLKWWMRYSHKFIFLPLVQSWGYGLALEKKNITVERYAISNIDSEIVGLVQVVRKSYFRYLVINRINFGPIFLNNLYLEDSSNVMIIDDLIFFLKKNIRGVFLFSPNLKAVDISKRVLKSLGYIKIPYLNGVETAILDLRKSEDELLKNLEGKWRNGLKKSLKSNVVIEKLAIGGDVIELLTKRYFDLQLLNNFKGISLDLLREFLTTNDDCGWIPNLYAAFIDGETKLENSVGLLLSIRSGYTETYVIGISEPEGRIFQVNSSLLWRSIIESRSNGVLTYDLGGVGKATPRGINKFKNGLNGKKYKNLGEWISISIS